MLTRRTFALALCVAPLLALLPARGEDKREAPKGLRVFSCGHSFHYFVPDILVDVAKEAGIKDHKKAGLSAIGGSRVIQHWDVEEKKNKAKELLGKGEVDVLTLSPIFPPDDGIEKFVTLALKHNKDVRVTLQENWLPWDHYDPAFKAPKEKVDHDAPTVADLKKMHAAYFETLDKVVRDLNKKAGKDVVFVVPIGQAVIALREKVLDGKVPGVKKQSELFSDAIGHAKAHIMMLNAYCHYAVIYKKSPVGLPVPAVMKKAKLADEEKLNKLLQEIAWEAVVSHPLSGVKAEKK